MEQSQHSLSELFRQLGLPADRRAIETFITEHKPLEPDVKLSAAPFWNRISGVFCRHCSTIWSNWRGMWASGAR